MNQPSTESGSKFVRWLCDAVVIDGRGDAVDELRFEPTGWFWLGRLAPEELVQASRLGERAERLDPCETGLRVLVPTIQRQPLRCRVRARGWREDAPRQASGAAAVWKKSDLVDVEVALSTPTGIEDPTHAGESELGSAFVAAGVTGLKAEVRAEIEYGRQGSELVVTVVNTSPADVPGKDPNIYEISLEVEVGETESFELDDLPGSFRYDRTVEAYGVNGGVTRVAAGVFRTVDYVGQAQQRPVFWDTEAAGDQVDLKFSVLATDPMPALRSLVAANRRWGGVMWAETALTQRAARDSWPGPMLAEAKSAAAGWDEESRRLERGVALLESDEQLRRAFTLMNAAFNSTVSLRHKSWRPFQIGFLLAALPSLLSGDESGERDIVDVLRFATGGGKTETYLGLLVMAAFYDRLRGKLHGVTGWARFPLRMLSLQQTGRFADVLAAAELVRRKEKVAGAPFSLGFFVGEPGTPNEIKADPGLGGRDPDDASWPPEYQVLLHCPFCGRDSISMVFDKATWRLQHVCTAIGCPWTGPLPFYIVDHEVFRFLPTVVVGTLDKVAIIALQAAMRGLYSAPLGLCSANHGFAYAKRSKRNGCLFPGCASKVAPLPQDKSLYPPSIRIQDELHLLRDSLGAIDAHYEALLDQLQNLTGSSPKILASSATIEGYQNQVEVLYRREGRVFPLLGPLATRSFWAQESDQLARLFVGLGPRGATIDFASDRILDCLQRSVRRAISDPAAVAREVGVDALDMPALVSYYGVDVVYGSTLKDVEAAARSFETQFDIEVNTVSLTGRTPLDEVRSALERLVNPEVEFSERLHLVAASSMLSHGVDIDRLNVMLMLGLPLATAEFIQTTARVGRAVPGIVFVLHKIGRERDHKVFRSFAQFVRHADRLVDPVPITRRSRRVLELTFPGLLLGRLLGWHEPRALELGLSQLTRPQAVSKAMARLPIREPDELAEMISMLGAQSDLLDEGIRKDMGEYLRLFFRAANDPATQADFPSQLLAREPMRSLRDVEEQVPVFSRGGIS